MVAETKYGPVLSRITSTIRKNVWGNCSREERPYKEIRHKLTRCSDSNSKVVDLSRGVGEDATPFPGLLHFTLDPYLIS